jgi:hypothetical protein
MLTEVHPVAAVDVSQLPITAPPDTAVATAVTVNPAGNAPVNDNVAAEAVAAFVPEFVTLIGYVTRIPVYPVPALAA